MNLRDGINIRPHFDSNGRDFAVERIQDCNPILDWNAEARTEEQKSDWGRHVARIPNVIILKWMDEEWTRGNKGLRLFSPEFDQLVWRKLQDPDWAFLRVDKQGAQKGWRLH